MTRRRAQRTSRVFGLVAVALLLSASGFAGGFLIFADQVARARLPERPRADGIVALAECGDSFRNEPGKTLKDFLLRMAECGGCPGSDLRP